MPAPLHRLRATAWSHRFSVAALLIACFAAWPLLQAPGLLNTRGGGDSPFLLQRLHQLESALLDGHFPVRWMPDANYGYGYPFYNFYAPLSVYLSFVARFIGFSYVRSIHLAQLAGFMTAAWGMYQLVRRWLHSEWAGLLAAASYTLAPFHLVNIYVRGDSLAEFWAMAFYPLTLLAIDNALNAQDMVMGGKRRAAWLALACAGLIVSHNISALIFSPFLLLYFAVRWWYIVRSDSTESWSSLRRSGGGLLLALALSAWFFVPALAERELAQLGPVTSGYFHFSQHFWGWDLIQSTWWFDYDVQGRSAFRAGLFQAITAVAGSVLLLRQALRYRRGLPAPVFWFMPLAMLLATFMITPLSGTLWRNLPLLAFSQFPWRFLSIASFFGAVVTGALATLPGRRLLVPGLILAIAVTSLGRLQFDHLLLTDDDITAEKLAQYEWFTGNIGTTVSAEYLPPTVQPRPYTSSWLNDGLREQVKATAGVLVSARLLESASTRQIWRVEAAGSSATLVFPTLYWPGWQATIAAEAVPIQAAPGSGLISLDVPAGRQDVVLQLERTPTRLAGEILSLAALVVCLWILAPRGQPVLSQRRALGLLALGFLIAGLRLWPRATLSGDTLTWDFGRMGYLHHAPDEGVVFSGGTRLESYQYDRESVAAGEALEVRVALPAVTATSATLELTVPAAVWPAVRGQVIPQPIARQTRSLQAGQNLFTLPVPRNTPAGLYVPHLQLDGAVPLAPSGRARGDLFLRPIRVTNPLSAVEEGLPALDARTIAGDLVESTQVNIQLVWLTDRPLAPNYRVSLRLVDAEGRQISQFDTQPGYGFQPSSSWQARRWTNDWLAVPVPAEGLGPGPYALVARLYDAATGRDVLTRRLGILQEGTEGLRFSKREPVVPLPDTLLSWPVGFADGPAEAIRLRGYELVRDESTITLTLYWQSLLDGSEDYVRFVHLNRSAMTQSPPLRQQDGHPRHDTYPTGQWLAGEIIADPVRFELDELSSGEYELVVGFYRRSEGLPRLAATGPDGRAIKSNASALPLTVVIE